MMYVLYRDEWHPVVATNMDQKLYTLSNGWRVHFDDVDQVEFD